MDDELLIAVARLDPLGGAEPGPPEPGSDRYTSILERAMTTDPIAPVVDPPPGRTPAGRTPAAGAAVTDTAAVAVDTADIDRPRHAAAHRRRRRVAMLALVAGVATVAGLAVTLSGDGTDPAAALSEATQATADVTSLRGTLRQAGPNGERTAILAVAGGDMRVVVEGIYPDGHVEGSTTVIVDDRLTQVALDGSVEVSTIDDDGERPRPFAASSAAVVDAALAGDDVTDLGQEQVRGVAATHYRVRLDGTARRALAGLEPTELGWFQLEDPSRVSTIDVWVAGGLIRRIELTGTTGRGVPDAPDAPDAPDGSVERTTVDYEDFGADIEITPLAIPESATPPA